MAALMRQADTIVPAVLAKLGLAPLMVRNKADERVQNLPKAYGGDEPRMSKELNNKVDNAQRYHELANRHRPTDGASLARAILGLTATGLTAWDTAQALKLPLAYCLEVMARGQRDAL